MGEEQGTGYQPHLYRNGESSKQLCRMRPGEASAGDLSCFDFCLSASGPAGLITFCLRSEICGAMGPVGITSLRVRGGGTWTKEEPSSPQPHGREDEQSVGAQSLRKQSDASFSAHL